VSAAGDQSPHIMWETKAEDRMQKLMGIGDDGVGRSSMARRRQIARYITDGVKSILPYMKANIEWNPILSQKTETVLLSRRLLGESDLADARKEIAEWQPKYEKMLADAKANPERMVHGNDDCAHSFSSWTIGVGALRAREEKCQVRGGNKSNSNW
jgi:hypothetical protein